MTRTFTAAVTAAALSAVSLSATYLAGTGPAAAVDIAYATNVPSTHITAPAALEPFAQALADRTDGAARLTIHWGGAVAQHAAILPALRDGLADMGILADIYAAQDLTNTILLTSMPMLGFDELVMTGVASEERLLNCPACTEELASFDIFLYGAYALPPQYLMCRDPIGSLDDLKGRKVRVTGPLGRVLAGWGMTPVAMPLTDGYEALERRQVDCTTGIETFMLDWGWWDSVKYVLDLPLGGFPGVLTLMSRSKLDSLPAEEREAILELRQQLVADSVFTYTDTTAKVRQMAQGDHGVTYQAPADDIMAAYREAQANELAGALAQAEKRGVADPQPRIDTSVALVKKWEEIVAGTGRDKAAFLAALKREVYDKLPR